MFSWATARCPATSRVIFPAGLAICVDFAAMTLLLVWQYVALRRHAQPGTGVLGAAHQALDGACKQEYELLQVSFALNLLVLMQLTATRLVVPHLGVGNGLNDALMGILMFGNGETAGKEQFLAPRFTRGSRLLLAGETCVLIAYAMVQLTGVALTGHTPWHATAACADLHSSIRHIFLGASLAIFVAFLVPALLWYTCFCAGFCSRGADQPTASAVEDGLELGDVYLRL